MDQFTNWLHEHSRPNTLLLVSGGSSGKAFATAWRTLSPEQQANYTITLADERYAEVNHANSNWHLLSELGVDLSNERHFQVLHNGDTMDETATHWGALLETATTQADHVVAILGIGVDHHIAGIKPQSPSVAETDHLTAAYVWDDFSRITITPKFFELIDDAVVYATGADKYPAVAAIEGDLDYRDYPSQLVKRCGAYTVYYEA